MSLDLKNLMLKMFKTFESNFLLMLIIMINSRKYILKIELLLLTRYLYYTGISVNTALHVLKLNSLHPELFSQFGQI